MDETTAVAVRRRRWWVPVALVFAVLLALLAAAVLFADHAAPERVARFVAAAKAEWEARSAARSPGDQAGADAAGPHRDLALQLVAAWPQALRDVGGDPEGGPAADAIAWRDHRGLVAPVFAALRAAAARADRRWPWAPTGNDPTLVHRSDLGRIGCREIAARIDEGAGAAAVDGALDLATFAVDLADHWTLLAQLQAVAILEAIGAVWTPERVARLSAADGDRFAGALGDLDRRWTWELPLQYDLAATVSSLSDLENAVDHLGSRLQAWRFGFSPRAMLYAAIEELRTIHASLPAATPDQPWSGRAARLRAIEATARASANQWVRRLGSPVEQCELSQRRGRAVLRLLRLELAWRFGHDLPALMDPTADGPIEVAIADGEATFRVADPEVAARVARRD